MRGPVSAVVWYDRPVRYIYVIGSSESSLVKVGISGAPEARLATLQCGNPRRLSILTTFEGTGEDEKRLHDKLSRYRTVGEWFDIPHSEPAEFVRDLFNGSIPVLPYEPDEEVWMGRYDGWDYFINRECLMP